MGAHTSSRQFSKTVFRSGMLIRASRNHVEVSFGPFAKPWPLVWKRVALAGLQPTLIEAKKPKLSVEAELESFLELLKPRAARRKVKWSQAVPILAGLTVILAAVALPTGHTKPALKKLATETNPCSLSRLKQVVTGDIEAPDIEFTKAESFGGITSGVLTCAGARYKYTLESKGLERVLLVGKLDS